MADLPAPPCERVLCSGEHYTLGRNAEEAQLVVPILRVSRVAGTFSLGSVPADAVGDPDVRARVTWTMHAASKSGAHAETFRGRNRVEQRVRPEEPLELGDGARIWLTSRYFAELRWLPLVVGVMRVPQLEAPDVRARAAALGVHLVPSRRQLDARCTHLCVTSARPSKTQLLALIRALRVVDAAFVHQVLRLDGCSPPELPDAEAHVPPSDAALPPEAHMDRACLAPDARRAVLFRGTTLLLIVPQLDRRYLDLAELAEGAQARVQVHDLRSRPINSDDEAIKLLRAVLDGAETHWAQLGKPDTAPRRGLAVLCSEDADDTTWGAAIYRSADKLGIVLVPQGVAAITECVLQVRPCGVESPWAASPGDSAADAPREPRDSTPDDSFQVVPAPGDAVPASPEGAASEAPASNEVESVPNPPVEAVSAPNQPEQHDTPESSPQVAAQPLRGSSAPSDAAHPPRRARSARISAGDLLGSALEDPSGPPADTTSTREAAASPTATVPRTRRAGQRQAFSSQLLDQMMGVGDPAPATPAASAGTPAESGPPKRSTVKYRELFNSQDRERDLSQASQTVTREGEPEGAVPSVWPGGVEPPMPVLEESPPQNPPQYAPPPESPVQETVPDNRAARSAKEPLPASSARASPPLDWHMSRPSLTPVEYTPMVRKRAQRGGRRRSDVPNFKKFRRSERPAPMRVPLVLAEEPEPAPAPDDSMLADTSREADCSELFLGENDA